MVLDVMLPLMNSLCYGPNLRAIEKTSCLWMPKFTIISEYYPKGYQTIMSQLYHEWHLDVFKESKSLG